MQRGGVGKLRVAIGTRLDRGGYLQQEVERWQGLTGGQRRRRWRVSGGWLLLPSCLEGQQCQRLGAALANAAFFLAREVVLRQCDVGLGSEQCCKGWIVGDAGQQAADVWGWDLVLSVGTARLAYGASAGAERDTLTSYRRPSCPLLLVRRT